MIELAPETSPGLQALLADSRDRERHSMSRRELRAEAIVGGAFVVAAAGMCVLLSTDRAFELTSAVLVFITIAIATQVRFEVGSVYTWPAQAAFVPSLFLLPPQFVPAIVAAALIAGKLANWRVRSRAARALTGLGDGWFTIGPALVLVAAGAPAASEVSAAVLLAALAAQFLGESLSSGVREHLHGGADLREQMAESTWIYFVDLMLSAVGYAIALAAEQGSAAILLALPLFAVFAFLAQDRRRRVNSALELSDAYRGTARMLSSVIAYDDAYTGSHTRDVADLAADVATHLGLDPEQRRKVEFGAMLHDVGKIAISKAIINKPSSLTEDEWALMRTHTVEGQRMLDQVGGLMSEIGEVVRWSHERYDGAGYPDGIAGEEIPIEARVVFCCDAFSAMTTDRPYREAMSEDDAVAELRRNSGTQFDARVVEALVACLRAGAGHIS